MYCARLYLDSFSIQPIIWSLLLFLFIGTTAQASEVYGPENLLKTMPTPFSTRLNGEENQSNKGKSLFEPLSINPRSSGGLHSVINERLNSPRLFLPDRITLGESSEFLVKIPTSQAEATKTYVAIAMADKNSGAKPILGHTLRLGSDRKLVAVGIIPPSGILSMYIEAPIQGDLIDQPLYFEAVIWSKADFSDLQIATPVSASLQDHAGLGENAVLLAGQSNPKKNKLFVFDKHKPLSQDPSTNMSSGRP